MNKFRWQWVYLLFFAFVGFAGLSCDMSPTEPQVDPDFNIDYFGINVLPFDQLPRTHYSESILDELDYPMDEDSIYIFVYRGDTVLHPLVLDEMGIIFVAFYYSTGDEYYLQRAEAHARKLEEMADEYNGALYFPYSFEVNFFSDLLSPPWYSGITQGEALLLFVRLYNFTGNKHYLELADRTFASFLTFKEQSPVWITTVDNLGYFWIEEYPADEPSHVLNGFITASFGLYEYYLATQNPTARRLFLASMTTIKHYLNDFRVPGDISYYCLKFRNQEPKYHRMHISQLLQLHRLTGDEFFEEMSQLFYEDYHE